MKERANKKVNDLVQSSMDSLNKLADVNTVIGTPIVTSSGCQVIPVSKITVGYLRAEVTSGRQKSLKRMRASLLQAEAARS